jgi:hypothetical protein
MTTIERQRITTTTTNSDENFSLSRWFLKRGEILQKYNERYLRVCIKERTLSFHAKKEQKATSVVSFDMLEKFTTIIGNKTNKTIRIQLRSGKDLYLMKMPKEQRQQPSGQHGDDNNYKEDDDDDEEEEWCERMNRMLILLPSPDCRRERGGGGGGGIENAHGALLRRKDSIGKGVGKIRVLTNNSPPPLVEKNGSSTAGDENVPPMKSPALNQRKQLEYDEEENNNEGEASSTVSSFYHSSPQMNNDNNRDARSLSIMTSQDTNDRVLDTFKAMELALRAKDELLAAQTQLTERLEAKLKERENEIRDLQRKLNDTKELQEEFDDASMRAMEMEDQASMLSVNIDSLTRELDDVRAQKAVVQNALLRESAFMQEREYELNKKLSDANLKVQKVEAEKKHQKDVYEQTERELMLSRDRLLAEIARERRNRGMFSPELSHQNRRRRATTTRNAASSDDDVTNNNNNNNRKEESPIRRGELSFASQRTTLNESFDSLVGASLQKVNRTTTTIDPKMLTPEEHSCKVQ